MTRRSSLLLLLATMYALVARHSFSLVVRDYNTVNFVEYKTFVDFAKSVLTYNGAYTNTNILVAVATPECVHKVNTPALQGAQRHAGGSVLTSSLVPLRGFPLRIEEGACAEVFFYKFNTSITDPTSRTTRLEHTALTEWITTVIVSEVKMSNGFDFDIEFFWNDESKDERSQGVLKAGQRAKISSFLGHVFSAKRAATEQGGKAGELVDFFVVDGQDYEFHPRNRLETCEVVPGSSKFVEGGDLSCDDMDMRFVEFTHNVWYAKRLGLNFVQPQLVPAVTDAGFENRRLPEKTFAWLKKWYEEEKQRIAVSEGPVGPCMNQHVASSVMTHLTEDKKNQLSDELHAELETWYGGPLTLTSIYGIRKYVNGSVLRMHVDTVNTHVVSAIINVDQKVDEDWPLVILDHNDKEHSVLMRPGDMLLYESAKLLHGRPDVFVGEHYDNIFIHYKPVDNWNYDWL